MPIDDEPVARVMPPMRFGCPDAALAWSRRLAEISVILSAHGWDLASDDVLNASVTLAAEAYDDIPA